MFNPFRPYLEKKSGIINLKTNTAFRGVIFSIKDGFLVLKNVELLSDSGHKKLDGEVLIQLKDVEFVQVI